MPSGEIAIFAALAERERELMLTDPSAPGTGVLSHENDLEEHYTDSHGSRTDARRSGS